MSRGFSARYKAEPGPTPKFAKPKKGNECTIVTNNGHILIEIAEEHFKSNFNNAYAMLGPKRLDLNAVSGPGLLLTKGIQNGYNGSNRYKNLVDIFN